tara:strand:- start:605 stop:1240 length:636 start_codon:yes stop_codon:yes gene_type:complete
MKQFIDSMGEVVGLVLLSAFGFIAAKFSKTIKKKLKQREFEKNVAKSVELKFALAELKGILGADRAMVLQFHNGGRKLGPDNFYEYFMTMVVEVCSPGWSSEIANFQKIPLSTYAESVAHLMKSPYDWFMVGLETNKKADVHFKDIGLETIPYQYNMRSMMEIKLVDEEGYITGKALFSWDEDLGRKDILSKGDAELALKTFREKIKKNLY